jgi:hypothetical protein
MGIHCHYGFSKAKTMATSSRVARRSGVASESERRPSVQSSKSNALGGREDSRKNNNHPFDKKKRNHLRHLRSITARLLREESEIQSSIDGSVTCTKNVVKTKSKHKGRSSKAVVVPEPSPIPEPFQKLRPWLESSATIGDVTPWVEMEASPAEIITMQHQGDAMTEHTTLCSAFEMLSFENFCNGGIQKAITKGPVVAAGGRVEPLEVSGFSPAEDDGFVVPREISFAKNAICGGCTSGVGCTSNLRDEELHFFKRQRSKNSKNLFKKALHPFKAAKADKSGTRVMTVKVYVDPPRPMGSNNSVGNSTLTMPKELQRSSTNTTI